MGSDIYSTISDIARSRFGNAPPARMRFTLLTRRKERLNEATSPIQDGSFRRQTGKRVVHDSVVSIYVTLFVVGPCGFRGKVGQVIKRHIAFHDLPKILCGREKVGNSGALHSVHCAPCVCPIMCKFTGFLYDFPTGTSLVMRSRTLRGIHGHRGERVCLLLLLLECPQ